MIKEMEDLYAARFGMFVTFVFGAFIAEIMHNYNKLAATRNAQQLDCAQHLGTKVIILALSDQG